MLQLLLFLHVLGAIVVFGPSFAFPLIASQARKSPQNGHFAAVVTDVIERRIIIPGAIIPGILLYLIAIGFAVAVQAPAVEKMVELTKTPPGPEGPSPEFLALAKKL